MCQEGLPESRCTVCSPSMASFTIHAWGCVLDAWWTSGVWRGTVRSILHTAHKVVGRRGIPPLIRPFISAVF